MRMERRRSPTCKRVLTLLVPGLLCCLIEICIPSVARSQARSPRRDRQAILRLENLWIEARDSTTLDSILAPDFVHPVVTGDFLTKEQHIFWAASHPPAASAHFRFGPMKIRLYGDVAVVNGIVIASEPKGMEIRRTIFTDVFAYRNGRWQAINAQELPVGTLKEP